MPANIPSSAQVKMNGPQPNTILGMSPANFSSIAGQMGAAFAPKDSWQEKLGKFASNLGVTQLQKIHAENQAKGMMSGITKGLENDPGFRAAMSKYVGNPSGTLQNNPNLGSMIPNASGPTQ